MGRIIKNEDQSNVTSAPLDKNLREGGSPGSFSSRIPGEKVSVQDQGDFSDGPVARGPVLDPDQTQRTTEPVQVDPIAPEPDPSLSDGPADPSQGHEEHEAEGGEEAADEESRERTDAEWEERLEEAVEEARTEGYEKGYSEGYDDGYDEAEETLGSEWEADREALIDDINQFEELWAQYIDENESKLVELTLQMAEAIVDAPLADSLRRVSEGAVIEAVAELAGTPPITITVHPVDFQRLQESGLAEHLTEKYDELQLESDPEREEGDWTVSSPAGAIRRRRSEVIDTLRQRLRLSASDAGEE